jgi:DNA uptake protein ComE-like DNA-binding protein
VSEPPDIPDEDLQASTVDDGGARSYLTQALALVGIVVLTVVITLWVTRDGDQDDVGILIPTPAPVTFQVSGEVMRPGVYSLDGEPRVNDAIDAAGGLTPDADGSRLNLALRVRDGAKVVVPGIGSVEVLNSGDGVVEAAAGSGDSGISIGAVGGLIDLNTATKDQLIAIPGVGDVRADSIIEWRTNNLINSASDLLTISGIGPATVDAIRDHVIQP